jgi:hypothetical protein
MHLRPASARYISFDDINFRDLATRDAKLLLDQLGDSLIIDEAQYAPSVFPEIKRQDSPCKKHGKIDFDRSKIRREPLVDGLIVDYSIAA